MQRSSRLAAVVLILCALSLTACAAGSDESAEVEALRQQVQELQAELDAETSTTLAQEIATTSPEVSETTTTTTTAPTTTTTTEAPQAETVADFIADYVAAAQTGNSTYFTQRLHPKLVEAYGQDQCLDYNAAFAPDPAYDIRIEGVSGPADWSLRLDGIDFDFSDVYTVGIELTDSLGASRSDMHVGMVGDRLYWFADCGDPLEPEITAEDDALVAIGGDTTSEAFDAPQSWRVEVATRDFCGVYVFRDGDGSTVEIKSGESDFVIQIRESGRFYIETTGCDGASAFEN